MGGLVSIASTWISNMLICSCHIGGCFFLTMRPMTVWPVWVARRKIDEWTQRTEVQAARQQILPRRVWRFLTGWMNLRWPFVPTGEQLILLPIRQSDALIEMATPINTDSEKSTLQCMATHQSPIPMKTYDEIKNWKLKGKERHPRNWRVSDDAGQRSRQCLATWDATASGEWCGGRKSPCKRRR